jgi:hypothetical protein
MRYPPAVTVQLRRSRWYGAFAVLLASVLIALYAVWTSASGRFDLENAAWMLGAVSAACALLYDAFKTVDGQLSYSQGQWVWRSSGGRGSAGSEVTGTLRMHLDLQRYMLVSLSAQPTTTHFSYSTVHWFHLEASCIDKHAGSGTWLALRRAIFAATPAPKPTQEPAGA